MKKSQSNQEKVLTRRERQIMDIIYRLGKATANEVREHMPEAPSYSAVRALLRILEEKGHLTHQQDGPRYVFEPTVTTERASATALQRVVSTFFGGSPEKAVAALLELSDSDIDEDEYQRLSALIEKARRQGR